MPKNDCTGEIDLAVGKKGFYLGKKMPMEGMYVIVE
jgi:hypothetical protein